jgi:hypothetical protein
MARGRPVVLVQAALVLAFVEAGSHAAFAQSGTGRSGLGLSLPRINLLGVVATSPASVNLSAGGGAVVLPGVSVAGVANVAPGSVQVGPQGASVELSGASVAGFATVTATSVEVSGRGASAVLSGASIAGIATVTSASVDVSSKGATVVLPNVDVAGVSLATTPLSVNLSGSGPLLGLPGVTVGVAGQSIVNLPPNLGLGDVVDQVAPIAQLFASIGTAEAFAPIDQLLNGLTFGDAAASDCAVSAQSTFGPSPASSISAWNGLSVGHTDHDGFQVSGGGAGCASSTPFQTLQRTQLPGVVLDASSAFGLKQGTLHLGFSGGRSEVDTRFRPGAALRDAGVTQGGATRLTSWSVNAFSLLTKDNWYAGSAVGGTWGRTETQNVALAAAADYDTSGMVVAGFVGSIVPLTETVRFDLRGTLAYQRTVGEAHADSLGIVYGDHVIEAADAILAARLLGVYQSGDWTIRPFLQAGVTHHLRYNNQLEISDVAFRLHEADTSVFAAAGLDFEINKALQLSVGLRQDYSDDYESVTGRLGFSARLN